MVRLLPCCFPRHASLFVIGGLVQGLVPAASLVFAPCLLSIDATSPVTNL
jgi:hypothetical protein